ncbi:MAG: ABC transporter substrate-binding protein, partial [Rhodobacter sp.]|nr:ABC transporter substrate-binding protein [Rhodobacter sp.]
FAVEEIVAAMTGDGRMAALFARHGVTWQPAAATQSIG